MSQTAEGALKAKDTILRKYGNDYWKNMGKIGGKASSTGGFGQGEIGRQRAKLAGSKGGKISKRKSAQ